MTQAQTRVQDTYTFKKGFSRSVSADNNRQKETKECKKEKTFKEERAIRHMELTEKIKETKNMIRYKTLRRDKCSAVKEWKACETLSGEIGKLLSEKGQLERELALLERKQKKSQWYEKRASSETTSNETKKSKSSTSSATTNKNAKQSSVDIRSAFGINTEISGSTTSPVVETAAVAITATTSSQGCVVSSEGSLSAEIFDGDNTCTRDTQFKANVSCESVTKVPPKCSMAETTNIDMQSEGQVDDAVASASLSSQGPDVTMKSTDEDF